MGPKRYGRKITPALEKEMLAQSANGLSTRGIAAWLLSDRGVQISHARVAALLKHTRQTRAEVATIVVREQLTKSSLSDLEHLSRELDRCAAGATKAHRIADLFQDDAERKAVATFGKNGNETVTDLIAAVKNSDDVSPIDAVYAAREQGADAAEAANKASERVVKIAVMKLKLSGVEVSPEVDVGKLTDDELKLVITGEYRPRIPAPSPSGTGEKVSAPA